MIDWRRAAGLAFVALGLAAVSCAGGRDGDGPQKAPPAGSDCLGLSREACRANPACEAIPYWGESLVACETDERGFTTNCPFEGCRPLGADCPSLDELIKRCPRYCSYNSFAIDPQTGCRVCDCAE